MVSKVLSFHYSQTPKLIFLSVNACHTVFRLHFSNFYKYWRGLLEKTFVKYLTSAACGDNIAVNIALFFLHPCTHVRKNNAVLDPCRKSCYDAGVVGQLVPEESNGLPWKVIKEFHRNTHRSKKRDLKINYFPSYLCTYILSC